MAISPVIEEVGRRLIEKCDCEMWFYIISFQWNPPFFIVVRIETGTRDRKGTAQ